MKKVFEVQKNLQTNLGLDTSKQNIVQWYNALTACMIEIGEALQSDTSWKNVINGSNKVPVISRENVIEETADAFIYLVNACVFYGISYEQFTKAVKSKQYKNVQRLLNKGETNV